MCYVQVFKFMFIKYRYIFFLHMLLKFFATLSSPPKYLGEVWGPRPENRACTVIHVCILLVLQCVLHSGVSILSWLYIARG